RIVLLSGPLGHQLATDAAAQLMLLDANGDEPIELHLSCPDGELDTAGMLAETIDLLGVEVQAVCRGTVGGPALAVVAAADRLIGRMVAHLTGEVAASALESYRRAGVVVYDLREQLDRLRLESVIHGEDVWDVESAAQAALLCGWNAFALQVLADMLLAADYES